MAELKGVVFDIDDTLYFERDYVRSGFWAIADFLSEKSTFSAQVIFSFLWTLFNQGTRGNTFDLLFEKFSYFTENITTQDLVQVYREHDPAISIQPDMYKLIDCLKDRNIFIGAVSDGPFISQTAKVSALGLERLFDEVVLTDMWGKEFWKPHPRAFEFLEHRSGLLPEQMIYIGDNPQKDFIAPNNRGWRTVRLRMPAQLRFREECCPAEAHPQRVASSVKELSNILE
jgi:putative hydrolase of the HAD superfamily